MEAYGPVDKKYVPKNFENIPQISLDLVVKKSNDGEKKSDDGQVVV